MMRNKFTVRLKRSRGQRSEGKVLHTVMNYQVTLDTDIIHYSLHGVCEGAAPHFGKRSLISFSFRGRQVELFLPLDRCRLAV